MVGTAARSPNQIRISDYEDIVGKAAVDEIRMIAKSLSGKVIQNINSTFSGGGVAEILNRIVPLMSQLGVDARWNVIKGNPAFFEVTKKFHNTLHGRPDQITAEDFEVFLETSRRNTQEMEIAGDFMFIHDPQPITLVDLKKDPSRKWIWRCHIDVSNPMPDVWRFLEKYIEKYDAVVFSSPKFAHKLPIRQYLITPSIDPLSDKNREITESEIDSVFKKYKVPRDKPVITQISRFDYLKDPVGVIQAFEMVRKTVNCRLVLAGGTADDDPEGTLVLKEVKEKAGNNKDIFILEVPPGSDLEINALQRGSTVILQKSIKEGFGLTVSEALWKAKPVVASAVGGIPLQVINNVTGLLSHGIEGTAFDIKRLLLNPEFAKKLGENGKEHVRQNFLITRHLRDYLMLSITCSQEKDVVYL